MMLIDLNKHLQEYIKVFGKNYVGEHIKKLLNNYENNNNNKKGEKNNALGKKKT